MFNFGRKVEKDPQKALDNAKKTMNSGLTGGLTKAFMGKDFVNEMNGAMDQGQSALDGLNSRSGWPRTAWMQLQKSSWCRIPVPPST